MARPLIVSSPQVDWSADFTREQARISAVLRDINHEIHHIGSTSIQGIYAKPIIDMLLLVEDLDELDARSHHLERAGWEVKGAYGIPERRYFRRHSAEGVRTHHLHAFVRGSHGALRHLAFRDYMNSHPDTAQGADPTR